MKSVLHYFYMKMSMLQDIHNYISAPLTNILKDCKRLRSLYFVRLVLPVHINTSLLTAQSCLENYTDTMSSN